MANAGQAGAAQPAQKKCFVVMGFGMKTDLATGRKIDLDKSYRLLIKPVVVGKGLTCVRADEILHSGTIDVPMYQELLTADFVIADISTANLNAVYELGIRHALRPSTTIVISENQLKYPFDLNHVLITSYAYLEGGGIDFEEVMRFRDLLGKMLDELLQNPKIDSPVYTYLSDLQPPSFAQKVAATAARVGETLEAVGEKIADAVRGGPAPTPDHEPTPDPTTDDPTLSMLIDLGEQAIKAGQFSMAKELFGRAIGACTSKQSGTTTSHREDPYLIQRLTLATYKAKQPDEVAALREALEVLAPLKPGESNDPETVGLNGAIEKRLYDLGQGEDHLVRAIWFYTRGYYLRDDYYNGINLAYLRNVRTDTPLDPTDADKIADLVYANRVRREVLALCDRELERIEARRTQVDPSGPDASPATVDIKEEQRKSDWEQSFWCLASQAEAYYGLGEMAEYEATRSRALAIQPPPADWMVGTFDAQIAKLRRLLEAHGHLLAPPWPAKPVANSTAS